MNILSNIHFYLLWVFSKIYNILYLLFQWIPTIFDGIHYNINHLPLHLLILSMIIASTIFIYIRIKYPFWSTQPVYHTYDFWRGWFSKEGLIQSGYPIKTRFYKSDRIKTYDFLELTDSLKKQTVDLIQSFSIADESAIYMFHLGNFDAFMTGHSYPSFISLYFEEAFIPISKSNPFNSQIDIIKKPIGCITSRSIDIFFNNCNINNKHSVYFLDFITINREKAFLNINISRELIHTHEYNQRKISLDNSKSRENKNVEIPIQISLFKKETELSNGIVPLVSYMSHMVYIHNERIRKLPSHFIIVKIHRRNIQILMDFLEISKTQFQCFGIAEMVNLAAMIHSGLLKIFVMQKGKEIYAAYFFRDSRTQLDMDIGGAILIFCGSMRNTKSIDLFYMGFLQSLRIILRENDIFKLLLIEGISQNEEIYLRYIGKTDSPESNNIFIGDSPSAYYLYNYIFEKQPLSPENCFMVF